MVRILIKIAEAIGVVLLIAIAIIGPGGVLAVAEAPFGSGPFSHHGRYCTDMHLMAHSVIQANASPTASNISSLKAAIKTVYQNAPNPTIKAEIYNYVSALSNNDSSGVQSGAAQINHWITSSCTLSYSLPYRLNGIWGGFMGQGF